MKFNLVLLLVLLLSTASWAQRTTQRTIDARMNQLAERLELNEDQATKVQEVMKAYRTDLRGLVKSHPEVADRRVAAQSLKSDMHADLKQILTEEQFERFTEEESKMEMRSMERRQNRQAAVEQRAKDLGLTEDQQAQIQAIHEDARDKRVTIRNQELSPEEQRAALKGLKADIDAKMREVLDEEQYSKWMDNQTQRTQRRRMITRENRPATH